jgi:hypothetical protein
MINISGNSFPLNAVFRVFGGTPRGLAHQTRAAKQLCESASQTPNLVMPFHIPKYMLRSLHCTPKSLFCEYMVVASVSHADVACGCTGGIFGAVQVEQKRHVLAADDNSLAAPGIASHVVAPGSSPAGGAACLAGCSFLLPLVSQVSGSNV